MTNNNKQDRDMLDRNKVDREKLYPALAGFYALTADGQIGQCDPSRGFVPDTRLSAAFGEYNRKFLENYLARPAESGFRLGIVYQPTEKRRWGSETLALETAMVKSLYAVSGPRAQELTEFQKKNREQSIYRGMELFLEYRNDHFPDAAIFAPILFNRETTLDQYIALLDRPIESSDRETPVIEVLNLIGGISLPKRNSAAVAALVETLHRSVVRKEVRRVVSYDIVDRVETRPTSHPFAGTWSSHTEPAVATPIAVAAAIPFADSRPGPAVAPVTASQTSASAPTLIRAASDDAHTFDAGVTATRTLVTTKMLQGITQFRHLRHDRLQWLAREATIYHAVAGTRLLVRGSADQWNFYLLEGKIELEAGDGAKQVIEGGTPKAAAPVAFLKPRKYGAIALTPASFLWINDLVLQMALNDKMPVAPAVAYPA